MEPRVWGWKKKIWMSFLCATERLHRKKHKKPHTKEIQFKPLNSMAGPPTCLYKWSLCSLIQNYLLSLHKVSSMAFRVNACGHRKKTSSNLLSCQCRITLILDFFALHHITAYKFKQNNTSFFAEVFTSNIVSDTSPEAASSGNEDPLKDLPIYTTWLHDND